MLYNRVLILRSLAIIYL